MSEEKSRRTSVQITFDGVDITKEIKPYLTSITYTDSEEDESDDLQIQLQDREGLWLQSWLEKAVQAAAALRLKISAVIIPENRWTNVGTLPTGWFELDSVDASGPPAEVSIQAAALPFSAPIRQTKKSKAWESYYLKGIAGEIAKNAGMSLVYEATKNPLYKRKEQEKESDIEFLSDLCHDAGISLKCTDGKIVLFDQAVYEAKPPIMTIKRGDGSYKSYSLSAGSAGTQYASCRVSYNDPATGKCIAGTATASGEDANSGQCLEITAKVASKEEAADLADKWLRMHNKYSKTASFTFMGNPKLLASKTVMLEGWGGWDGKYIIKQATHTVGSTAGYETKITLRRVIESTLPEQEKEAFKEYQVQVTASALNVRSGAGTDKPVNTVIRDRGTYTIVEEADGKGATKWGKLKTGAGWVSLDWCKKI